MFQLRQLRIAQAKEQHDKDYIPPVDEIKKLQVDPYTLKLLRGAEGDEKSWWSRIPEQKHEKLLTGYEAIIARRESEKQKKDINADFIDQQWHDKLLTEVGDLIEQDSMSEQSKAPTP